jgi:serine protease Do
MLSLAVSLLIAQAAASKMDAGVLGPAWTKIQPSVVVLLKGESKRGTAALIDPQGYFITGKAVVAGNSTFEGQFNDGRRVTLLVITTDGATQLALLRTYDRLDGRKIAPLYRPVPREVIDASHPKLLIAALSDGPMTAQLVSTKTLALVGNGHEVINVSEIHFDGRPGRVAGAPVFSMDGSLVGVLSATLTGHERRGSSPLARGAVAPRMLLSPSPAPTEVDPSDSVLYAPGPIVMQRVIAGFLTPQHAVIRPAIGAYCQDAPGNGALIDAIQDDSPADLAGMKESDVIISIDGFPIRKAFDFGRTMLRQTVGSTITIVARRHGRIVTFHVRVGM